MKKMSQKMRKSQKIQLKLMKLKLMKMTQDHRQKRRRTNLTKMKLTSRIAMIVVRLMKIAMVRIDRFSCLVYELDILQTQQPQAIATSIIRIRDEPKS
jgi:hypothetical protein